MSSDYSTISEFGSIKQPYNDPTLYAVLDGLDSQFMFGSQGFQKGNYLASEFMANRCSANWDGVCQAVSESPQKWYPRPQCCPAGLTDGQAMLRETAFKKYLLYSKNCWQKCEVFDPTVADSPLVCHDIETAPTTGLSPSGFWALDGKRFDAGCALDNLPCQKVYGFTEAQMQQLDFDKVMDNLLRMPNLALDLLKKLAVWAAYTGNKNRLLGTKFGQFATLNQLW